MRKCLFTSNLKKIEQIHSDFKNSPANTLREEFALGHGYRWPHKKNKELYESAVFKDILEYMATGQTGDFKQFKVYPRSEIWRLWKISEHVPILDKLLPGVLDSYLLEKNSYQSLESASEISQSCMGVLLAIKAFVIKKGMEKDFRGYHPQTSPVVEAEVALFGAPLSPKDHKELCETWSDFFSTTPTGVNTVLWSLGIKLRGLE